ncbi:MAG: alpha-E domain-containing protein [Acidobacteria bacterium]|nr:alpha-E domain-containing protein [Acidobacteriota bacterium]
MSRYIERAEDLTRLLAVNFHTLLDAGNVDSEHGWQPLIAMTHDEALYQKNYAAYAANDVIDFMLWNQSNPNALIWCITMARENARSVREQLSKEMWEYLNRLYFAVREADRTTVARSLLEFFSQIRDGSQAFQGITNETMMHGEAYQFIQLGKHLERSEKTARILDIKYKDVNELPEGSPEEALQLIALLKSCSAFEPFRKEYASQLSTGAVVEYLLLNREFPRAVAFGLNRCLQAVNLISGNGDGGKLNAPQRSFGRLVSELEYLDIQDILGARLHSHLDQLLRRLNHAGEDITRAYFSTQVILPELHPQQAQQQQQ